MSGTITSAGRVRRVLRLRGDAGGARCGWLGVFAGHGPAGGGVGQPRCSRSWTAHPRLTAPEGATALPPGGGHVRHERRVVRVTRGGAGEVLREIDLDVPGGRTVAVVGATGSGKTSLVMADPAAVRRGPRGGHRSTASTGQGRGAGGAAPRDRAGGPTTPSCLSATLRDNIAYARPGCLRGRGGRGGGRRRGLTAVVDELPDGYQTMVGERGLTLSGGQRQRRGHRAGAAGRPARADPRRRHLQRGRHHREHDQGGHWPRSMEGRTTFVIAHRMSTISLADEVIVLEDGRIAARGEPRRAGPSSPRSTARSPSAGCPTRACWRPPTTAARWRGCELAAHEPGHGSERSAAARGRLGHAGGAAASLPRRA